MKRPIRSVSSLIVLITIVVTPCRAQCQEWSTDFAVPGTSGPVSSMVVFDDGTGPALFIGGSMFVSESAPANNIVKWDGTSWFTLGTGTNGRVATLAVFDDGTGSALYAGGEFTIAGGVGVNYVAKWNGTSWSALSSGMAGAAALSVRALTVYDDGSGAALYAGGLFTTAGGTPANRIAKWNGSSWSAVGTGANAIVNALLVQDFGAGPQLFAGGAFTSIGGVAANRVARWDGTSWLALGSGVDGSADNPINDFVSALAVYDDGSGVGLYVSGHFQTAGGSSALNIARWKGSWSALAGGLPPYNSNGTSVLALAVYDDGAGAELYAGGLFSSTGSRIAKWNGASWSTLDAGISGTAVYALATFDSGSGEALYVGGGFDSAGAGPATNLARWKDAAWSSVVPVGHGLVNGSVSALAEFDDGSGAAVYAGGSFLTSDTTTAGQIAKWDGDDWSPVGGAISRAASAGSVNALATFDDGAGIALYAGGHFVAAAGVPASNVAKWDGAVWSALGSGVSSDVEAFRAFDDGSGSALFVGGKFTTAGGVSADRIAKWDGANWSPLDSGVGPSVTHSVVSLEVFDDGTGAALYVGGLFTTAGGNAASNIAKWDGTSWSSVGAGLISAVEALAVFDDGSGPALYAGGQFTGRIARWNGSTWATVGSGANHDVLELRVFDDGTGAALYAGGSFGVMGGLPARGIAKWNGSTWSAIGAGVNGTVSALLGFDDGTDGAADLYVGGSFSFAGGVPSSRFAELFGCEPGVAYCFGDGIDSVVTAQCPCANFGDAGRGCANSNAALGGARLFASGTTSPNTLVFTCDGIPNNTFATFLRSSASDDQGFVFGDGIKCLSGTGIRFGSQNAGQGGNPANTVISAAATVPSGNTRYYQLHYRNPNAGFCPPETFNISNGYQVAW